MAKLRKNNIILLAHGNPDPLNLIFRFSDLFVNKPETNTETNALAILAN